MVTLSRNSQVATMTSVFTGADESWPMSFVLRSQICSNMDEIQKAESEMKLARVWRAGIRISISKSPGKGKWEHIDLLLNVLANLVTKGMGKAEMLFAFVLTGKVCCQTSSFSCLGAGFRRGRCHLSQGRISLGTGEAKWAYVGAWDQVDVLKGAEEDVWCHGETAQCDLWRVGVIMESPQGLGKRLMSRSSSSKEGLRKLQTGQLHLCLHKGHRANLLGDHF